MQFSVLMSIYKKEKVEYFIEAVNSVVNQTLIPTEIVIVKDGPLTKELDAACDKLLLQYPLLFRFVMLDENQGLGRALQIGVEECKYELIARMDTDDISKPNRFELQVKKFEENPSLVLLGSNIEEFSEDIEKIESVRSVPESYQHILKYSKKRNPFNHMTVMFKKEYIIRIGNYPDISLMQDYYLWMKVLARGYKVENIKESLVYVRADDELFVRRGGITYFYREIKLQKIFLTKGFITWFDFVRNLCFRGSVRIMPNIVRRLIYRKVLRT